MVDYKTGHQLVGYDSTERVAFLKKIPEDLFPEVLKYIGIDDAILDAYPVEKDAVKRILWILGGYEEYDFNYYIEGYQEIIK